jgi:hypothetical protein
MPEFRAIGFSKPLRFELFIVERVILSSVSHSRTQGNSRELLDDLMALDSMMPQARPMAILDAGTL